MMKTIAFSLLLGAAALGLAPAAAVQAQTQKNTARPAKYYVDVKGHIAPMTGALEATLTFDKAVQIPKAILPAGTYLFTLITPSTMRVTDEEGTKVFAIFNTMGTYRSQEVRRAQLRFEDTGEGQPPRLIGVFPEGSVDGFQPLYSKKQREANAPIATGGVR